ncbi:hypothetical protein RRG08_013102 [Elysia crispata]|uniref:Uncharacterized protein n=1 Tax=Elysia crispata TaxID=231223 RepID=A0AAE1A1C3_9GAST|nr:hypothetical protein RRG08_013102 [Elysia crispata]
MPANLQNKILPIDVRKPTRPEQTRRLSINVSSFECFAFLVRRAARLPVPDVRLDRAEGLTVGCLVQNLD